MSKKETPFFFNGGLRKYRKWRRGQIKMVLEAIEQSNITWGCAFDPWYSELKKAVRLLEQVQKKMQGEKWRPSDKQKLKVLTELKK